MSLLLMSTISPTKNSSWAQAWIKALHQKKPDLNIDVWPDIADPTAIQFVLTWTYPHGELLKFPNLKAISSTGAGVDHILNDPQLPKHVPLARLVDKNLVRNMNQYVVWAVLNHIRDLDAYAQSQTKSLWIPRSMVQERHIGILGLGQLGSSVAQQLQNLGLQVSGWSRSQKQLSNITSFSGEQTLKPFLNQTDVLICLLPLTSETKHILNTDTFNQLRKGAYVINVARGEHLIEKDLIAALDSQQLSGACLDVFQKEPLPQNHPFWQHPKIKITPHISSVTDPVSASEQVIENYDRALAGKPLLNVVDLSKGY